MKHFKPFSFLKLRIYRRTFGLYLLIVALSLCSCLLIIGSNALSTSLSSFTAEVDSNYTLLEQKLGGVVSSIDIHFVRLYAAPSLRNDFLSFFESDLSTYLESRLSASYATRESYLDACQALVYENDFSIRHILHFSTNHIVDLEYSADGSSRYRVVSAEEAQALAASGLVYTKSIQNTTGIAGSVEFVIDPSAVIDGAFSFHGDYAVYGLHGRALQKYAGTGLELSDALQRKLAGASSSAGRVTQNRQVLFYAIRSSLNFGYSVICAVPAAPYVLRSIYQLLPLFVAMIVVFTLITLLYVRKFSTDSDYLEMILSSIGEAQSSHFLPIEIGNRTDEFATIAEHLNAMYHNLELLIRQKYMLTINQQRTEMSMLSAQLNPHFLYNTLERIRMRALMNGDSEVASATANLGNLYRNIVKAKPVITIREELAITEQYLELMSFLYGEQLLYHCDIPEKMFEVETPKIWMQPILENFFKYNFPKMDDSIKVIIIQGRCLSSGILIELMDNLGRIDEPQLTQLNEAFRDPAAYTAEGTGIGLHNVCYRLHLYYGDRLRMSIKNNAPSGVCIQIYIKEAQKHV